MTQRYIVLDVETTGLSPRYGARVIEIGAVVIENGHVIGEFHTLINIESPVPKAVQRIHGITNAMLIGKPKPHEAIPKFHAFIRNSTLIAHNARFDIGFLKHEFHSIGIPFNPESHCTLEMCRRLFPGLINHKLETVYKHLCGDLPHSIHRHRALDDARLTAKVWMEMVQENFVKEKRSGN